jgi:hypothetical protein
LCAAKQTTCGISLRADYPNRDNHQILSIAAAPAPSRIAVQIYPQGIMTR